MVPPYNLHSVITVPNTSPISEPGNYDINEEVMQDTYGDASSESRLKFSILWRT